MDASEELIRYDREPVRVRPRVQRSCFRLVNSSAPTCGITERGVRGDGKLTSAVCAGNPPNYPTGKIERKYYAPGPWAVTIRVGGACCDSAVHKFDLYYPTHLGANGVRHASATWGNGSFGRSANYRFFLKHIAGWGIVVIATQDSFTGAGQTILDGAQFLLKANTDPKSIFYRKLNPGQVGAFGHSQGAGGAINAMIRSAGAIKTVIPIELPSRIWCTLGTNCAEPRNLVSGSIFLIDGSADAISPPTQPSWVSGEQSIAADYDAVPNSILKLKAALKRVNHNDISGQPSCVQNEWLCANGVYGYLGYLTAWMMAELRGDNYAKSAFVDSTGEIFSQTRNWENVASNVH
jgi:hypothetical protein